jgi:hypothetical protein
MPKKLQIKLLSQSAELLSITNCAAGHISVLRSETPGELRPYQRALSGTQGKERFIITVDGATYKTDDHNLIGFGEIPPHSGLTVSQYLSSVGLIEGAITGLLNSFGIEGIERKSCSALSPDEERKVRIFAATADPNKVLVINEPFEPIMSGWRERLAEFLTDFARAKNGLVVVTSLSYRPDSWIDNPIISRHQVGQSLRRTIGFGSSASEDSQLINQLRDQIRAENIAPSAPEPQAPPRQEQRPHAAAMSFGAAALLGSGPAELSVEESVNGEPSVRGWMIPNIETATAVKAGLGLGAGGLGIWAALALLGVFSGNPADKPPPQQAATLSQGTKQGKSDEDASVKQVSAQSSQQGSPARSNVSPSAPTSTYILDGYPQAIRISLLDTSKGTLGEAALPEAPIPQAKTSNETSGNFYKLLESASTDKADSGARDPSGQHQEPVGSWNEPESSEPEPEFNATEEEERREAIRQKFLEAIRAAADRREQGGEE